MTGRAPWRKKQDRSWRYRGASPVEEKLAYTVCPYLKRKLSYVTRRVALQAAAKYQAVDGRPRRPYLCPKCFDWHLTSHPENGPSK